jgi:hypothetical protein
MSSIAQRMRHLKSDLGRSQAVMALLAAAAVERRCHQIGHVWRASFWSPATTLLAFLFQSLNGAKTLRAAVADVLDDLLLRGNDPLREAPSADPSAFCAARRRLPEAVLEATLREATARIISLAGAPMLWLGRRVRIVDGSAVSMPDEPALQEAFPQPHGQRRGCGFPVMRMLAVFCWGTGAMLEVVMGSLHEGERTLFRRILEHFGPDDVVVADRGFCSYTDIARLAGRGADVVFRLHHARPSDFRRGRRLGHEDCLIAWARPKWIPSFGLTRAEFEALPAELTLRLVRTRHAPRGFRSREIVIVTTILDPAEASVDDLLALYRDRWMAELNLRSLKTHLKMDVLRGRSVDVVRKEALVHVLLYNLIRVLIWEAALATGRNPRRLSFTGTLHRLQSVGRRLLADATLGGDDPTRRAALLAWIAGDIVPHRPGRVEPRRVKRRPKNYSRLTRPRTHYRKHGDPTCR